MQRLFLFCLGMLLTLNLVAQDKNFTYYDISSFTLEGTLGSPETKENPYHRLPASLKDEVRKPVWRLSKNSAGISVRFQTNSSKIKAKWTVLEDIKMNHMAETGIKGLDLYVRHNGKWKYVNTGRPYAKESKSMLIENMSQEMREYRLFLPLYDGVVSLEIGIDTESTLKAAAAPNKKPIVFYGTSLTQGGCASRPGMVHTNIISRELDREVVNLGFSGNGRMEEPIVNFMADTEAQLYIVECVPNMSLEQIQERTAPLVELIRKVQPNTPIVFVETQFYEASFLDKNMEERLTVKNQTLRTEYDKIVEAGVKNVYYISHGDALQEGEGTVDGVHFTDLGFQMYADYLLQQLLDLGLIKEDEIK